MRYCGMKQLLPGLLSAILGLAGCSKPEKATTQNEGPVALSVQSVVGTWVPDNNGWGSITYKPDGTFTENPVVVPGPINGTWKIDGDKLVVKRPRLAPDFSGAPNEITSESRCVATKTTLTLELSDGTKQKWVRKQ